MRVRNWLLLPVWSLAAACSEPGPQQRSAADSTVLRFVVADLVEMGEEDQRYRDVERIMALPAGERRAEMEEAGRASRRHVLRLYSIVDQSAGRTRHGSGPQPHAPRS